MESNVPNSTVDFSEGVPDHSSDRGAVRAKIAAVAVSAALALSLTTACQPEVNPHKCDQVVGLLGDSRHRREGDVIPKTSNEIFRRTFGNVGRTRPDGSKQYVEYFAEDGTVHEQHAAEIKAFAAKCSAKEHPIILDFMGANYAIGYFSRPPEVSREQYKQQLVGVLKDFYMTNAPAAKVVLGEYFFGMDMITDSSMTVAAKDYMKMYTEVQETLVAQSPATFFFQPKPAEVDAGKISFVDAFHPTSQALSDLTPEQASALDQELLDQITASKSSCAILGRDDFGLSSAGQIRVFYATLRDMNPQRNKTLRAWLDNGVAKPYLYTPSSEKEDCSPLL